MKTAVLFSGGKDSALALKYALDFTEVKCLITLISENDESYMFHVPNINWTSKQAESAGFPLIVRKTTGQKEEELSDLKQAIEQAIKAYGIEGIVTGAIGSVYQASRIQGITNELGIECFNPLWQKDQFELLEELIEKGFEVTIVGVFGEGLDGMLGKSINKDTIKEIKDIYEKLKINPAGEGGEYESFTLDGPYFKKKLIITKSSVKEDAAGGKTLIIEELAETQKERKK